VNLFAPPPQVIELRPYQADAVDRLREGIRQGCRRQILVAPTGAGKTLVAMNIIAEAQKKGATAWFIVDRVTLIDQTSAASPTTASTTASSRPTTSSRTCPKPVQVASAQTWRGARLHGSRT
jgi:DNA repair protein RadD